MTEMYIEDIIVDDTPREGFIISTMLGGYRVKERYIDWDVPNATDDFITKHGIEIIH